MACVICSDEPTADWTISAQGIKLRITPELCKDCGDAFAVGVAHVLVQLKTAANGVAETDAPAVFVERVRVLRGART